MVNKAAAVETSNRRFFKGFAGAERSYVKYFVPLFANLYNQKNISYSYTARACQHIVVALVRTSGYSKKLRPNSHSMHPLIPIYLGEHARNAALTRQHVICWSRTPRVVAMFE